MVATVTDEQSAARELVRGWARTAAQVRPRLRRSATWNTASKKEMRTHGGRCSPGWRAWASSVSPSQRIVAELAAASRTCVRWSTRRPGRWYRGRSRPPRWPLWLSPIPSCAAR